MEDNAVKKVLLVLLSILLTVAVAAGVGAGVAWYQSNHIFIQGDAYPLNATSLDLTDKELTFEEYEQVKAEMPYCSITWMVPFQGTRFVNTTQEFTLTSVTREDLDLIHTYFPEFTALNADGCKDYALLAQFQTEKPDCTVYYRVDLGGTACELDTKELTLSVGEYDYDVMMENLSHLPEISTITLKTPEISLEQIDALKEAYEGIEFHCTAMILGKEYDTETTELDLSALTSDQVAETAGNLSLLTKLSKVELMDASGASALTKEDVKALMEAAPQVVFNYTFDFFGETVSTASEEVMVKNKKIGDENEQEVRLALDLLTNCKRMVLDNCKLSNEVLAQIREDYRDRTKVVWRVWFGQGTTLTDAEVIRAVYKLYDDNSQDLYYCEDAVFMDIGHNEYLDSCDFVAGMTSLEFVIASGAPIKDLTPFGNCKNLKFLEIAFCEYVDDLTPLANCTSLEMLNISNTHAIDLSPLDELPLTHLVAKINPTGKCRVPVEERERFIAQHPDCWASFEGEQPYGPGWRYTEDNKEYLPYYAKIRDVFRYSKDPNIPNHVGWYLEEDQK